MTLYSSGIKSRRKWIRSGFGYLLISIFFAVFGAVYEIFSHEVYSFYMIYGFMIPLTGGTLPFLWFGLFTKADYPNPSTGMFYHCGILTLAVGSIVRGILDIYGTSNGLVWFYWIAGSVLIVMAILQHVFHSCFPKKKYTEQAEPRFKPDVVPMQRNQCLLFWLLLSLLVMLTSVSALKMIGAI